MCNYKNKKGLCMDEFFDIMLNFHTDLIERFVGHRIKGLALWVQEDMVKAYEEMSQEKYLKFSDELLEVFWNALGNVCIDEDENIDEDFWIWGKGTFREDIWHWFDDKHSKGVGWLANEYEG